MCLIVRGLPGDARESFLRGLSSVCQLDGSGARFDVPEFIDSASGRVFAPARASLAAAAVEKSIDHALAERVSPLLLVLCDPDFSESAKLMASANKHGYACYCLIVENRQDGATTDVEPLSLTAIADLTDIRLVADYRARGTRDIPAQIADLAYLQFSLGEIADMLGLDPGEVATAASTPGSEWLSAWNSGRLRGVEYHRRMLFAQMADGGSVGAFKGVQDLIDVARGQIIRTDGGRDA